MSESPSPETISRMQRWFAVECNNRAWDLASQSSRTPAEDRELLAVAYAAAYHWSKVGQPLNDARADQTLAHALSTLGHGEMALACARRCLDFFEHNDCADWDLAFAHAEIAFAAAILGDADLHARHYTIAKARGEAIKEDEDRKIFFDELNKMPTTISTV